MCAIAGVLTPSGVPAVRPLLDAIRHRGPDQTGVTRMGPCAIGAARLAIVDPANGAQPMRDDRANTAVAFNGEIYNARELRDELIARGHAFRSRCDTEVVLRGWIEWGLALPERLRGMFAIAVLEPDRLTLLRDPLGIKPLRYVRCEAGFCFASEAKALLGCLGGRPGLDAIAFADFVALGYPTGGRTLFAGISALPAGHYLTVDWDEDLRVGEPRPYRLRPPPSWWGSREERERQFTEALLAATRSHLQADVEVAAVLSGGIDSAMLAFMAAEMSDRPLRTFTVADAPDHPDAVAAERVAAAVGADHTLLTFGFDDYLAAIPATIAAVEAPDLHAGPLFHLMCRQISRSAKVCLNGEGADETLGGYFDPDDTVATLQAGFRRAAASGLQPSDRAIAIRDRLLAAAANGAQGVRATLDIALQDQLVRAQLDPVDHIAMASGVEIRVPYLDAAVQEVARGLPPDEVVDCALGITKKVLRRAALRRYGARIFDSTLRAKLMMPDASRGHARRFAQLCDDVVSDETLRRSPFGGCFASRSDFVLFELFRRIYLSGSSARSVQMTDLLDDLSCRAGPGPLARAAVTT